MYVTFSDCGGVGSAANGGAQASWTTGMADVNVCDGARGRFSPLSWKTNRVKHSVNSALAGETISLSTSIGEAEC